MMGPGRYDEIATAVREVTNARAVCVIVVDGDRESGFSVQASDANAMVAIANAMQRAEKEIRKDHKEIQRKERMAKKCN